MLGVALAVALIALALERGRPPLHIAALDEGSLGLGLALRRLPVAGRVLYVTAHPDDEDNGVLAALSRGRGLAVALLTLTRGEGGQNAIGPELSEALGILRSEELNSAHRYDGADQYFTRACDFGFSFDVDETLDRWGHEEILEDVVRVLRSFRPDIILTLPLGSSGHQHHAAAARLAQESFRAAADPARFPGQLGEGLKPWQARRLYAASGGPSRNANPQSGRVVVRTRDYDPLLDMSWAELGRLARAQHRSQALDQEETRGRAGDASFWLVDGEPGRSGLEGDIFGSIDVSLRGLARFVTGEGPALQFVESDLAGIEAEGRRALESFGRGSSQATLSPLRSGLQLIRALRRKLLAPRACEVSCAELRQRIEAKEQDFLRCLFLAHGLALSVEADAGDVTPGRTLTVTAVLHNAGAEPVDVEGIELELPERWEQRRVHGDAGRLQPGQSRRTMYAVTVAPDAPCSRPYWTRDVGTDRHSVVPPHGTRPWSPREVVARLRYVSAGVAATAERPALCRPKRGGRPRAVAVVPALSVSVAPEVVVLPPLPAGSSRELLVSVLSHAPGTARLRLEAPPGWSVAPREVPLAFAEEEARAFERFKVAPPPEFRGSEVRLQAVALRDRHEYAEGYEVIAYDHVEGRHFFRPAVARIRPLDVRVAPDVSVAYVVGMLDGVPEAIRQLGLPLTLLTPGKLAAQDLSRYSTIVTGVRAYELRADLRSHHARLMRYVEEGGHLVVQPNRSAFNRVPETLLSAALARLRRAEPGSPFAPYPARVSEQRVTDETAPVQILAPASPLLHYPNRIGAEDWEGWIQERGLQLLEARDTRYVELVSAADPFADNPGAKKGLLVEARVGKGTWIYLGLSLFRQLPEGVPGAYRLLANLVSRPRGG